MIKRILLLVSCILFLQTGFVAAETLILQPDSEEGKDANLNTFYNGNENYGVYEYLIFHAGDFYNEGILEFDLNREELIGETVSNAKLSLWQSSMQADGITVDLYSNTGSWDEQTVTFRNRPAYDDVAPVASLTIEDDIADGIWRSFDVTAIANEWISDFDNNFGLKVIASLNAFGQRLYIASSDHPNPAYHPKLEIEYQQSFPDIQVGIEFYDFGDVAVGSSSSAIISISNAGGGELEIYDISLAIMNPFEPFDIVTQPPFPVVTHQVPLDLEIIFLPELLYARQTNSLVITSNDGNESVVTIELTGYGVLSEVPSEALEGTLKFVDMSVEDGSLTGFGNGNSGDKRLKAFKNMLDAAGDLIDAGFETEACDQLAGMLKKCDGAPKPSDFVAGASATDLYTEVSDIISDLDCGQ